ncbi:hypothetical protein CAL26_02730 [Bordetella genomosp. 9]|uniref:Uncharacterized protein n=2 Tax=Bordetella genomosp. 9 TaxID=1416803 RepID=A0A261RPR0_9BORD|nr:hypothetical protein CAL26_02730 [Bordetella genomosp. 9]
MPGPDHPCRGSVPRGARCAVAVLAGALMLLSASGCSSLFSEGAAAGAGVGGAALASKVTRNPTVAAGIGLGALAAAQAGVKYVEKNYHEEQQDRIASAAGPLAIGKTAKWESRHAVEIEPDAHGRVTVSRQISAGDLNCKEIVFSVDDVVEDKPRSDFYTATICEQAGHWKWASAEPATARWGSLQ